MKISEILREANSNKKRYGFSESRIDDPSIDSDSWESDGGRPDMTPHDSDRGHKDEITNKKTETSSVANLLVKIEEIIDDSEWKITIPEVVSIIPMSAWESDEFTVKFFNMLGSLPFDDLDTAEEAFKFLLLNPPTTILRNSDKFIENALNAIDVDDIVRRIPGKYWTEYIFWTLLEHFDTIDDLVRYVPDDADPLLGYELADGKSPASAEEILNAFNLPYSERDFKSEEFDSTRYLRRAQRRIGR